MSKKQYEDFLVDLFFKWAETHLSIGEKIHFKSPNDNNSLKLYKAFLKKSQLSFLLGHERICYFEINGCKIIPVLHGECEYGYTENYISLIRDLVSGQKKDFKDSVLLIIHNSSLDTLNNSSKDLSILGNVWNPQSIHEALTTYIDQIFNQKDNQLSKRLLNHQFELISSDGATMFGFRKLFDAVQDGKIEFHELGYLNDVDIQKWYQADPQLIDKRLSENKKLKDEIEYIFEQFPTEYKEKLVDLDFSEKFIKENFDENDLESWKISLDYEACQQERKNNSSQLITFQKYETEIEKFYARVKSDDLKKNTLASREHYLIVEIPDGKSEVGIDLVFENGQLAEQDVRKLGIAKKELTAKVNNRSKKKSILELVASFEGQPKFLDVNIKRLKPKECFKFKIILLPKNEFPIEAFATKYLINSKNETIVLEMDESEFKFNEQINQIYALKKCDEEIDLEAFGTVSFDDLLNTEEVVTFLLKGKHSTLKFEVQGVSSTTSLSLPLFFNQEFYLSFFNDDVYASYNVDKACITFMGREYKTRFDYKKLLEIEDYFLKTNTLSKTLSSKALISIDTLQQSYPDLGSAYANLYTYLRSKKTLVSLVSWGQKFCQLVEQIVNIYTQLISNIQTTKLLSIDENLLVNLGFSELNGEEYITPLHPLNLAYYLKLAYACKSDSSHAFKDLHTTTIRRLNAQGLLPFNWHPKHRFTYSQAVTEHPMWIKLVPHKQTQLDYIELVVKQKTVEFLEAFKVLFKHGERDTLLINSIHNGLNKEVFLGIVDLIERYKSRPENLPNIHISIYNRKLENTYFDDIADATNYTTLKVLSKLSLNDQNSDQVIDLIRRRITYSKFEITEDTNFNYAHLTFVRNDTEVEEASVDLNVEKSGIASDGLLAGETSFHQGYTYFTSAGLEGINLENNPVFKIVSRYSALSHAAWKGQNFYESNGLSLKVSNKLQELLESAYENSLWTIIIDPKVTLDFFKSQQDVVLIHYSDNYTNSAHYDAITVTKRRDLYDQILSQGQAGHIDEFNAFNGEWLLKMLTLPENSRREKKSIIAAYKYVNCLLFNSDITWVPLSVAEMVRVSGNIGFKMSESDFSTYCNGKKFGVMSDDVLFVGFKDQKMYLLPLEVKVGQKQKHPKGIEQAKKLKEYLENQLFGRQDLAGHLYRGLFVRQIMMQVEKYQLYKIYPENYFDKLLESRTSWLQGNYDIANIQNYPEGFVTAFVENSHVFDENFELNDNILVITLPGPYQNHFISTPLKDLLSNCSSENLLRIPDGYILNGVTSSTQITLSKDKTIQSENILNIEVHQEDTLKENCDNSQQHDFFLEKDDELAIFSPIMPEPEPKSEEPLRVHFGENVLTKEQLYWEPTNTAKFMNTNTGIIGTMGTGKTQFTKSLITQLMQNQNDNVNSAPIGMLIFDYKSDYVDDEFIQATNAQKYELHNLPYNPLSLFGNSPMLPIHTATGFAETMRKAFNLGIKQQLKLENLILACYEDCGINAEDPATWSIPAPTINDVWNKFLAQDKVEEDSLYAALFKLAKFKIFETDSTKMKSLYDLMSGVVVIELGNGYAAELKNLVVALTLDLFYVQMQKQGKPVVKGDFRQITKMICVDEAQNILSQNFTSLLKILKEGREYGVGLILSTQNISHFKTSEHNYADYMMTWVIHRVAQISNGDIKAIFNVDDKSEQENLMETIRRLDKHYSLYIDGHKKLVKMKDKAFWELCQQLEFS